jgi:hypothetical protein
MADPWVLPGVTHDRVPLRVGDLVERPAGYHGAVALRWLQTSAIEA